MQFHSQTTKREFLEWLREKLVKEGQPQPCIDLVDDLLKMVGRR